MPVAVGCGIPPPGAPMHPERKEPTSLGGLWWHLVPFGMSAGGVSMKIIRANMNFHTPPWERFLLVPNEHPGAPKAPAPEGQNYFTFGLLVSYVIWERLVSCGGAVWLS